MTKTSNPYNIFLISVSLLSALLFHSCDSGDIYPEEKDINKDHSTVSASFRFLHLSAFPKNYNIVLATYVNNSLYPTSSVVVEKPVAEGTAVEVSLDNIPPEATSIELTLNQQHGKKKVFTFYEYVLDKKSDKKIKIPVKEIDLATFARLQKQLFTAQCIQCHGGGGKPAANLFLLAEQSHSNLVNINARGNSAKKRVAPGSVPGSFLIDVLTQKEAVRFNHTDISTLDEDDFSLLKEWIIQGAKND